MKTKLLLSNKFKKIGIAVFIPFAILGLLSIYKDFQFPFLSTIQLTNSKMNIIDLGDHNLTNEFALCGVIIGLLMIAFSSEKNEDEFIHQLRLECWQWAVIVNYGLLLLANWLIYGIEFLQVMLYNMLTVLFIFIIRFHIVLNKYKKA